MRKILLLLTSVMMVLGMAACGGGGGGEEQSTNTPEAAVVGYLDAFKAVDQAKLNEYVTEDDVMYSEDTEGVNSEAQVVFGNISYEIKSVNAEEGSTTATVTTDVTNVDMTAVMQSMMTAAMTESGDVEAMDEEKSMEMLKQAIEDNKENKITKTVDIEVTKVDDQWKVKSTDELLTALSGGIAPTF